MRGLFFIVFVILSLPIWAQKVSKIENKEGKKIKVYDLLNEKSWMKIDSGSYKFITSNMDDPVVYQNDKIYYMGQFEVTNEQYQAFLTDLKAEGKIEEYTKYYPDSTQWDQIGTFGDPMMEYYFRHPAFKSYPIVNISVEAAHAYCKYLTKKYLSLTKKKYKKAKFRLPTEEEWGFAAGYSRSKTWTDENLMPMRILPWDGMSMRQSYGKHMGMYMANFKPIHQVCIKNQEIVGSANFYDDGFMFMSPVEAYFPNSMNMYDVSGNVAELTTTKTNQYKLKGGSWFHSGYYCQIVPSLPYEKPSPWIGFRVLIEVKE